jgi:hypothetical protein
MQRKVNFIWEIPFAGWRWEASRYEGNGIFFGKVKSPFVPDGELGTWYYWDIKQNGAILVQGSQTELDKLIGSKSTQKAMEFQRIMRGEG